MNKIQKLVHVTLGSDVVEKLATALSVRVTVEDLLYALTTETGKSVQEISDMDLTYEKLKGIYQQSLVFKVQPFILATVKLLKL